MFRSKIWCVLGYVMAVLSFVPLLSAVIVVERVYHGKRIGCAYSGLVGVARSCGTRDYERVFTGTVKSATDVGDFDKRLEIQPEEVFLGDSTPVVAITTQACLGTDIKPGDKWLFYLIRDPKSNTLVVPYDSPSKPIAYAKDDLAMLRRLAHLTDSGILMGTVELEKNGGEESVALTDHTILAKSVRNGRLYSSRTNEKGFFMFELPAGQYRLSMAPEYRLRETESSLSLPGRVPVDKGLCWEHSFIVKPTRAHKRRSSTK